MNHRKLILSIILLQSYTLAISEKSYQNTCKGDLSYHKQLICSKHSKRLHQKTKTVYAPVKNTYHAKAPVKPKTDFKSQRLAARSKIKPYIPGGYKKQLAGDQE